MSLQIGDKIDFRYHEIKEDYVRRVNRLYKFLAKYHDHHIEGMEHIPDEGPCIIAVNHSFATYDFGILQYKIYKAKGVFARGFADNAFFKLPAIGRLAGQCGALPGEHKVGDYVLKDKKAHIMVAPGGMREALRPRTEKYQIKWERRKGFVRLALRTNSPIVLAACPAADDLYRIYESGLTKFVYKKYRMPFPMVRSNGKGIMPRKIPLVHYISPPMHPPVDNIEGLDKATVDKIVDDWHAELTAEMEALMRRHTSPGERT